MTGNETGATAPRATERTDREVRHDDGEPGAGSGRAHAAALASGQKIDGSGPIEADLTALEADQNLTFTEWFAFQEAQARAHATGVLRTDEAQTVYVALGGEAMPPETGWAEDVDLALKVTITTLIGQLMGVR